MLYGKEGPDKVDGVRDVIATWLIYGVVLLGLVLLSVFREPSAKPEPTVAESTPIIESVAMQGLAAERPQAPAGGLLTQSARIDN
jgi:hypothetical protein